MRNRAKRRMRAAAAETVAQYGTSSTDYVLIGRAESTCNTKFKDLKFELIHAFKKLSVRQKCILFRSSFHFQLELTGLFFHLG